MAMQPIGMASQNTYANKYERQNWAEFRIANALLITRPIAPDESAIRCTRSNCARTVLASFTVFAPQNSLPSISAASLREHPESWPGGSIAAREYTPQSASGLLVP